MVELNELMAGMDAIERARSEAIQDLSERFLRAEDALAGKRYGEARGICKDILEMVPETPEPLGMLGEIEMATGGDIPEAVDLFCRALTNLKAQNKPPNGRFHMKLAELYLQLGMTGEAITHGVQAAGLLPHEPIPLVRLGEAALAHGGAGSLLKGRDCFLKAMALDSQCWEAHQALGFFLISNEHYRAGFREYEWRKQGPWYKFDVGEMSKTPEWTGMFMPGHNILVVPEGGYGDMIQFSRFLPRIKPFCDEVILACPTELADVIPKFQGLRIVSHKADIPQHSAHVAMMSLPYVFDVRVADIAKYPPALLSPTQGLTFDIQRPAIGISWRGRKTHRYNALRSVPVSVLAQMGKEGFGVISLQKDATKKEKELLASSGVDITRVGGYSDWGYTAALVQHLDAVVTIDSSVAHLSASLGIDTRIMLPQASEWRWGHENWTPWYPSARLYRDGGAGWGDVVQRVRKDLSRELGALSAA